MKLNITKYANLCAGILFLVFTAIYATQFSLIRITPVGVIDSRAYPRILLVILTVLSLSLIWASIRELRKNKGQGSQTAVESKDYRCVLITILLSAVYVAVLARLGFLIASALYIFLQTINLCPREKLRPIKFAIIAIVSSFLIYTFFRYGLTLILPGGLMTGIF